jgi:hypothetical protein
VLPIELSSQRGLVASLIQFKCMKYFRDDLTLVLEDAQCFNYISEPSSEIRKTSFILFSHCNRVQIPLDPNEFSIGRLQCQNNMKLVFRISEDGSEIELKHYASSRTSVKSSQKYFVHLNWIRLATNSR